MVDLDVDIAAHGCFSGWVTAGCLLISAMRSMCLRWMAHAMVQRRHRNVNETGADRHKEFFVVHFNPRLPLTRTPL